MKILSLLLLVWTASAYAQTGLIAHKSHSGTSLTYSFADPGNFGAPSPQIVSIKWINDTTVVKKMDRWGGNREDTIFNHPVYSDPNIPLDSMKQMYWGEVIFLDTTNRFKSQNESERPSTGRVKPVKNKKPAVSPSKNTTESEPSKKRKSALWFFVIGGGTFAGMMLISRRKKLALAK